MGIFKLHNKVLVLGILVASPLRAQEEIKSATMNSCLDWHLGGSYSFCFSSTSMYDRIWNTVGYLAILQREGSYYKLGEIFRIDFLAGLGWAIFNRHKVKISLGGEYQIGYFSIGHTYTFGKRSIVEDKVWIFQFPFTSVDYDYAPPTGSQQQLFLKGLEHKISPYFKISFAMYWFPVDLQFNLGVSFIHLLFMHLKDFNGDIYKADVRSPSRTIKLHEESIEKRDSDFLPLNFGLNNTFQLALTVGAKAYLHSVFLGFNYTTNIVNNAYQVEVGLIFKNNIFKSAWN